MPKWRMNVGWCLDECLNGLVFRCAEKMLWLTELLDLVVWIIFFQKCCRVIVIISWWILVSFKGFLKDYNFCMVKYLSFHNSSSFALKYFFWQSHTLTHPLFLSECGQKMVMDSFKTKIFMQPMSLTNMHEGPGFFCFVFGCCVLKEGSRVCAFVFVLAGLICSDWVLNWFPSSLQAFPKMFPIAPHFYPIYFGKSWSLVCSLCHWPKCGLVTQLIFPSQTIFYNSTQFAITKLLKIQCIMHIRSKKFQIALIKSLFIKNFPTIPRALPDSPTFF